MKPCVFLVLVFATYSLCGQTFEQLTQVNSISLENANAVIQDDYSYMWFSTDKGVFRYDGHVLVSLNELLPDSISIDDKAVRKIKKDDLGNLWMCGMSGILICLNPKDYDSQVFKLPLNEKLTNNSSFDLSFDEQKVYIATETGMLAFNKSEEIFETIIPAELLEGTPIRDINTVYGTLQDRFQKDKLWLLTRGGLLSFIKSTNKVFYHTKTYTEIYNYSTTALWEGSQDDQGRIWLGGGRYGLKYFDPATEKWHWYISKKYRPHTDQANHVRNSYYKSKDELWVFSTQHGFGYLNTETNDYTYFTYNPESSNSILKGRYNQIFQDKEGAFWITGQKGVSYFNPSFQKVNKIKIPPRNIYTAVDPMHVISWEQISVNEVLVGTMLGDGLYSVDIKENSIRKISKLKKLDGSIIEMQDRFGMTQPVFDVLKTKNGITYVVVAGTLLRYHTNTSVLLEISEPFMRTVKNGRFYTLNEAKDGSLWFTTSDSQVLHLDGKDLSLIDNFTSNEFFKEGHKIKGDYINSLSEDSQGNIWVSSYFGLFKLNPITKKITPYISDDSVVNEFIRSASDELDISGNDELFLTSRTYGILKIDLKAASESYKIYTMDDGLSTNTIYCVTSDNNFAWFGTSSGLIQLELDSDKVNIVQEKHGIEEDNFLQIWFPNIEISDYGKLFFYSTDYFAWMDVEGYSESLSVPIPKINAVSILNNEDASMYNLHAQPKLKLNHDENYFSIHFGSDNYTLTERQNFKYLLEGYDEDWNSTSAPSVSYTKVPPGNYNFHVAASDFNGNWSHKDSRIEINITPPFWKTIWFRLLCLFAFLALCYIVYKYWENNLKEKERIKVEFDTKIAQIEMDALRAQMNPHFLFNCLNSIKNYALTKGPYETADYLTKFSHLIRLILQNSKEPTVMLKDELEALKLYVEIEDLRFAEKFEYEFIMDDDLDVLSAHIPPMILQPYVENAIWHGLMHKKQGKGKLKIEIKNMGNYLQCTIEDNGIGREKAMEIKKRKEGIRKKSLGMKITKNRIDLTNQLYNTNTKVNVVDLKNNRGEGIGTRIIIDIPLLDKQPNL